MSERKKNSRYSYTAEELRTAVSLSWSYANVLRLLGVRAAGGNYETLKKRIKDLQIDISHMTGKGHNLGKKTGPKKPLEYYLVKDKKVQSDFLRRRLLKDGVFDNICSKCKLDSWNGQPIPLELDHINGDRYNNQIENLRILCPNCHAQTPTYRGKKKDGKDLYPDRKKKLKDLAEKTSKGPNLRTSDTELQSENKCLDCEKKVGYRCTRCRDCNHAFRIKSGSTTKIEWPPLEELIKLVDDTSYSATGRSLGVSDNAVRKHIRNQKK